MMKYFLQFEIGKGAKYFKTKKVAKSITGLMFTLVFLLVFAGVYMFFVSSFKYINYNIEPEVRLPVTLFIYEVFLLILSGIIVFSCMVSGLFSLFRGENDNWIISSPAFGMFPKIVFTKSLFRSVWPFFVAFLPAVLAFCQVYSLSIASLFFIFMSFVVLLILLNALTLSVIIFVGSIYFYVSRNVSKFRFSFGGLIVIMLFLTGMTVSAVWRTSADTDIVKLFRADETDVSVDMSGISSHFYFLPTHPFALEMTEWQDNNFLKAMEDFFLMLVIAGISVVILWRISGLFYPLWQKLQEGNYRESSLGRRKFGFGMTFRFSGGKVSALFKKEALVLVRNPRGMLWFLFLLFIWLSQIGTSMVLGGNIERYDTDVSERLAMLQSLQFIVAVYFICSFTLRFVFPAFSLEKKTAWILASAPIGFKRIYFGKYLFYVSFFVTVGGLMGYINASILNLGLINATYSMALFVVVIIFIVTLGLSLGAVFPNFETDDPEVISTSMPGLFFTALSLIYGASGAFVLYSALNSGNIAVLTLFIVMTIFLIAVILQRTPGLARNRDFSR